MLCEAPARGLPGSVIERVVFQQGDDGYPMDDVVIMTKLHSGETATLEIQAKRSITFAPRDPTFAKVMLQVATAANKDEFWERKAELAVATSQTSRQISGPYQEVLRWARETNSSEVFFARLERRGTANDDMRSFVSTFRDHLSTYEAAHDDLHVWKLLKRFQILVFDFSQNGGAEDYWAIERAKGLLQDEDRYLAGALWSSIIKAGFKIDASGSERGLHRQELVKQLTADGFTLEPRLGTRVALQNLAEASAFAMDDISDSIQNVSLSRHDRLEEVHTALSEGRYLEIRGSAGVGKSAILKRYVSQITNSSSIIFFSPNRTNLGGWQSLRHAIEFKGSAEEFLVELSASGSSILCIDNLDFFSEQEKSTVKDLVRAAGKVPGVQIIVTARLKQDHDEHNWLPTNILDDLGRAPTITLEELSDEEVKELRSQDPRLAALLQDNHPAKLVARNLFRLSRLALLQPELSDLRSEVDLINLWWSTGDGAKDEDCRDRQRLMHAMSEHYAKSSELFSSHKSPPRAIQQLVGSETLMDHGNDKVSFKHDALREWAVASIFNIKPKILETLDTKQSGSPFLLRSLELQTQMMIEASDRTGWVTRLEKLSASHVHSSWYRTVLLAIVHSERSAQLLGEATPELLADDAKIGRQFISLVIACESQSLKELIQDNDNSFSNYPDVIAPKNSSWNRTIVWLLKLEKIPTPLIPVAAELMRLWMIGLLGHATFSKEILTHFYNWLIEIESAKYTKSFRDRKEPFDGGLSDDQVNNLEGNLRFCLCVFAEKAPALARKYLKAITDNGKPDHIASDIFMFNESLAKVVPQELLTFTKKALVGECASGRRHQEDFDQGLTYLDTQFMPASPAQGPFYSLLTYSPKEGLKLVLDLVNHVVDFQIEKLNADDDQIIVPFDFGDRVFRYSQSFHWSRHSQCDSVTSALMALEAWGHKRVENGDSSLQVALEIIAPENTPVAILTVAIDILLSSDTTTYADMVPFLASPELVAMDRRRPAIQDPDDYDYFGISSFQKEPIGEVSKADLKGKPSRQTCLERLVPAFAFQVGIELREALNQKLQKACERLGEPEVGANFADPRLMAMYLRAQLDPQNYEKVDVTTSEGKLVQSMSFKAPPDLARFTDALDRSLKVSIQEMEKSSIEMATASTVEDPSKGTIEFAEKAAEIAKSNVSNDGQAHNFAAAAAVLVLRDGDAKLKSKYGVWAADKLKELGVEDGDYHDGHFSLLRYNRAAMALTGLSHALELPLSEELIRPILMTVANNTQAIAPGLGNSLEKLNLTEPKLVKSIVRVAVAGCIFPWRDWQNEAEYEARKARSAVRISAAIDAEVDWILNDAAEPNWPELPPVEPKIHHGIRIGRGPELTADETEISAVEEVNTNPDHLIFYGNSVARIITAATSSIQSDFFLEVLDVFWPFTKVKNGVELTEVRVDPPREWNNCYYSLLAEALVHMPEAEVQAMMAERLKVLPDNSFLSAVPSFLQRLDDLTFGQKNISVETAAQFRESVGQRMMMTASWRRLKGDISGSMSTDFRPAISSLFFNSASPFQPATSLLLEPGIRRLDPAIPTLMKFISSAPSYAVAVFTMNLVEVVFMPSHKPMVFALVDACLKHNMLEREFWIETKFGAKICTYFETFLAELDSDDSIRQISQELDGVLNQLISIGIPEAQRLHDKFHSKNP